MDNLRIDQTLTEIGRAYRPGFLLWLKRQTGQWERLLHLEVAINRGALAGDEATLTQSLADYKSFSHEMLMKYVGQKIKNERY